MPIARKFARGAGVVAVSILAVGSFAWGMRLESVKQSGRDLAHADRGRTALASTVGSQPFPGLTLASAPAGSIAQAGGDSSGDNLADSVDSTATTPADTFRDVYDLLEHNYVDGVPSDDKLTHGAVAAMLQSLQDPYSRFLEPAVMQELQRNDQGDFDGIGAVLDVRTKIVPKKADDPTRDIEHPDDVSYQLTVVAILPGSPADKAGLRVGDIITDIDGHWIASYNIVSAEAGEIKAAQDKNDPVALNKLVDALQKKLDTALTLGEAEDQLTCPAGSEIADTATDPAIPETDQSAARPIGKSVVIAVSRPGSAQPLSMTLDMTQSTHTQAVTSRLLSEDIGLVKIWRFNPDTGSQLAGAIHGLGDLKGLVVDLRGATGRDLSAGEAVAGQLSTGKILGYRQVRGSRAIPLLTGVTKTITCPVVGLVDSGSSGTAELVGDFLRTSGDKLIGSPTFGDSADIRTIRLRDGSGFTLTTGELMTASGHGFNGIGIKPQVLAPAGGTSDNALSRAVLELSGRVARVTTKTGLL